MTTEKGGRPRKFNSAKELENKLNEYFNVYLKENPEELADIESLAVFLDCDRDTILNYEKIDEFFGTIKKAKTKILNIKKQNTYKGRVPVAFMIFDLKNNHGYTDKQEIESNVNSQTKIVYVEKEEKKEIEKHIEDFIE